MEQDVRAIDLGRDELGKDAMESVKEYIAELKRRGLRLRSLVVFGSRARGDHKPWSDIDVLVIAEAIWVGEVEPRGYTPQEFLEALWRLNMTALDACYEGRAVYDGGFWPQAKEAFGKVAEFYRLKKVEDGWQISLRG